MGNTIFVLIIGTISFMAFGFLVAYFLSDGDPLIALMFAIIFGCLGYGVFKIDHNTKNPEYKTAADKIQDSNTQNINIYINGTKVTAQEEIVDSQDNSYSVLISGTAINPQYINLNDCDFSVDTENHRITIAKKGAETGMKDAEPYEIHINGSDINIENLNLNNFTITVDEENRWIVLTEKE